MKIQSLPAYDIGRIIAGKAGYFIVAGRGQLHTGEWVYQMVPLADPIYFTEEEVEQLSRKPVA